MKRLWIAAGLLLAVAALCVGALRFQLKTVDRLEAELAAAVDAVTAGDADAGEKAAAFVRLCRSEQPQPWALLEFAEDALAAQYGG